MMQRRKSGGRAQHTAWLDQGWIDLIIAWTLAILALALYLRTLAPGLLAGDAGEFQFAAWRFGLAHPTGYPLYRLEWQDVGSLQRRLRNCMSGMRAEPFAFGSPEHVADQF